MGSDEPALKVTKTSMFRTALQPKWLGALLLAIVFAAICGRLGLWQLDEARAQGRAEAIDAAAALPVAPLTEVVAPQSEFPRQGSTRRITASGTYAAQGQVLITDRRLNGEPGYWVVTPLIVSETGAWLPVLRGFVADPALAPQPPSGEIALAGGLAPGESPTSEADLPEGVYRSIDLSLLVNTWDTEVYNAFVFATDERPIAPGMVPPPLPLDGLTRVPPPTGEVSELNLKNAMYAVQWWIFAGFGFFLWWRAVRQAHREELEATQSDPPPTRTPTQAPAETPPDALPPRPPATATPPIPPAPPSEPATPTATPTQGQLT